jgi:hypothetical protein
MDLTWLDSLTFAPIPAPVKYYDLPKLTVSTNGLLTMNSSFQRLAGETRRFHGEISGDGRCLVLRPGADGPSAFSPKGVLTHRWFQGLLEQKQIKFPATYIMEWIPEREIWVGCSRDLSAPPQVKALLQEQKRGRRHGA